MKADFALMCFSGKYVIIFYFKTEDTVQACEE